jgi:hypothetical protein
MNNTMLELLKSNLFSDYLKGVEQFLENIRLNPMFQIPLDQETVERTCAIMMVEKWAEHDDYLEKINHFMTLLPDYAYLLSDEKVTHHMQGISIFLDSISQNEYNLSGFLYASHSGYLMSGTACEAIVNHFVEKAKKEGVTFFKEMQTWFEAINSAQFAVAKAVMEIENWTQEMAFGLFNVITQSEFSFQSWLLGSLYKQVENPIIKAYVFERYLEILNEVKQENPEDLAIDEIIEMVRERSLGN